MASCPTRALFGSRPDDFVIRWTLAGPSAGQQQSWLNPPNILQGLLGFYKVDQVRRYHYTWTCPFRSPCDFDDLLTQDHLHD
jgi:hypothetical protein